MNEHIQEQGAGRGNGVLLALAVALVVAGLVAFYLLSGQAAWVRWLAVAAGVAAGLGVFAASGSGRDFRGGCAAVDYCCAAEGCPGPGRRGRDGVCWVEGRSARS